MHEVIEVEYNAVVEFDPRDMPDAEVDRVMDELAPLHVSLGWCPSGRPHATVTLDADDVGAATAVALQACEAAFGTPARSVEVLPTVDFDARSETVRA